MGSPSDAPLQHCMILAFFLSTSFTLLDKTRCQIIKQHKLVSSWWLQIHHFGFFLFHLLCLFVCCFRRKTRRKKSCWIILCVVFECERLLTSEMRSWNPMNFVFTSLSSPPRLWFLCSRLFAGLACPFFFSRHKTQAACLRVKVTNFSLARSTYVAENFFWQEIQRFTWTATFSWRKIISRRRRAKKYLANKFSPIHWAIIYKDEFLQQNNFEHGKECWVSETFG